MSHRNKIWYIENHETLTEARHLFSSMYNPIKHFFDMYLDVEMPNTYKCNEISITVHLNVTQWFLAIFMEHRLNTAFSVA